MKIPSFKKKMTIGNGFKNIDFAAPKGETGSFMVDQIIEALDTVEY